MSLTRDDILPWGRHKGEIIKDVPTDYFQSVSWVICQENSEFFAAPRHRDWVEAMMKELEQRGEKAKADQTLAHLKALDQQILVSSHYVSGKSIEIEDVGAVASNIMHGVTDTNTLVGPQLPAHPIWSVMQECLDNFSKSNDLLKLFVQRVDKNQGIYIWLLETAKEALKYGDNADDTRPMNEHLMEYAGLQIDIFEEGNHRTVRSVIKL